MVIDGGPASFYSHIKCAPPHAAVWTYRHPPVCARTEGDFAYVIHGEAQSNVSAELQTHSFHDIPKGVSKLKHAKSG